ncbi:MAG: NmrA family NAD(P)-binding protein, partial [Candidatus Eremiobacteraeota bacterium]|nr:NmrA family NAD(P)-binding protein [Candidatus Eremiobacteraeota bacterium]
MPQSSRAIVLAGGTGDLGGRIATAFDRRKIAYRALVRPSASDTSRARLEAAGAIVVEVDYDDAAALRSSCEGASCVVSALNGLEPVMI